MSILSGSMMDWVRIGFLNCLLLLDRLRTRLAFCISTWIYLSWRTFLDNLFVFLTITNDAIPVSSMLWIVWRVIDEVWANLIYIKEGSWSCILRWMTYHFPHFALFHYLKFFKLSFQVIAPIIMKRIIWDWFLGQFWMINGRFLLFLL